MGGMKNPYRDSCRVCLITNTSDVQMAELFTTTYKHSLSICSMLTACTSLSIIPNDGLSNLICTNCLANLISAYEFQLQCIRSDKQMRVTLGFTKPNVNEYDDCDQIVEPSPIKLEIDLPTSGEMLVSDQSIEKLEDNMKTETSLASMQIPDSKLDELSDVYVDMDHDATDSEDNIPLRKIISAKSKGKRNKIKKEFPCMVCGKVFNKNYRLLRHSNVHNAFGKPYECSVCKIRFASESSLIRHDIKHTDALANSTSLLSEKPQIFICPECPREFLKQESLSSHLKTHKIQMSLKEYQCEYCPKTFCKLNLLTRHAKTHDEIKTHKCNICDRIFALGSLLIDHMNKHKGVKPHVCHVCNKRFQQSCTLKDHIRTHNGETPYLCSECGKSFNNSSNLRQHILRHTGIKPFECTECPSRFSCKGGLKSHMTTHSGIKPYVCDLCGSSFTKTYSLAKHKRIHTGERPYSCEMCDMRFNSSDHVKRHMRTHTGEKPYKCQFCDRAFAQSNDLVKHTRSHVGDNTYQCKDCPAAFRLQGELRNHSKIHFILQKNVGEATEIIIPKLERSTDNCLQEDTFSTSKLKVVLSESNEVSLLECTVKSSDNNVENSCCSSSH